MRLQIGELMFANRRHWLLTTAFCGGVTIAGWLYLGAVNLPRIQADEPQDQESQSQQIAVSTDPQQEAAGEVDAASRIVGATQCLDCHRSEYLRWKRSKHATRAFDLLRSTASARRYAEALDIEFSEIAASTSLCVKCHATRQIRDDGVARVLPSVSCESCHGPSGGVDGWLNAHSVYGEEGGTRLDETKEHYLERTAKCGKAGQLRSEHIYALAKNCYSCHVVANEALVNEAEHPVATQNFDFSIKSLGDVRHNYHLDQQVNAEIATLWLDPLWHGEGRTAAGRKRLMFVVGAMVDLEMSLRTLASATDEEGDFFEAMSERVVDAYELIQEDILEEVEDLPLLEKLLETAEAIYTKLDDEEFALDDDRQACVDVANAVSAIAREFAVKRNGNQLDALEEPEVPEDE
ncbi:MAG: cytochrome c family protein [Planctomycetota bacterium]|nr:cytochrome c family protein [Planctomycetota bacterium]